MLCPLRGLRRSSPAVECDPTRGTPRWPATLPLSLVREETVSHLCHAIGCSLEVPPKLLMCARHWFMLPENMRQNVWRAYRAGQEVDKRPSSEYLAVAQRAIAWVEVWEAKLAREREAAAAAEPLLF